MPKTPIKTLRNAGGVEYTLSRKAVKNINLRVRPDGSVVVSANSRESVSRIDGFVAANAKKILEAQEKFRKLPVSMDNLTPTERRKMAAEFLPIATALTVEILPKFQAYELPMPEIRLRCMKARWGSCYTTRNIIVLNSRLLSYSLECTEFVITHELCHYVHPNHSPSFYALLDEMMPHWRGYKEQLSGQ